VDIYTIFEIIITHYKNSWLFKRSNLIATSILTKKLVNLIEGPQWLKWHVSFDWFIWLKWPFSLLGQCDQKWTFLIKMDMGVVKWNTLSINIYSQIGQYVYTFNKKRQRCSQMWHGAKWDMYNHTFWKRKYYMYVFTSCR